MTTQTKALKEAHDLSLDGRDFAARQIILDVIANLEKEALAKPALMIYRGELCYKSQEYDQSFGMWCPVTQDLPFPEGTKFYTTPPQRRWVGLTQTQVKLLWEGVQEEAVKSGDSLNWVFYTHINEALKEKNT